MWQTKYMRYLVRVIRLWHLCLCTVSITNFLICLEGCHVLWIIHTYAIENIVVSKTVVGIEIIITTTTIKTERIKAHYRHCITSEIHPYMFRFVKESVNLEFVCASIKDTQRETYHCCLLQILNWILAVIANRISKFSSCTIYVVNMCEFVSCVREREREGKLCTFGHNICSRTPWTLWFTN